MRERERERSIITKPIYDKDSLWIKRFKPESEPSSLIKVLCSCHNKQANNESRWENTWSNKLFTYEMPYMHVVVGI
uniref:Uncharacterized protein n=1 Tax=Rhizophora mucronata TaxID=61149 RepID=A0A2P2QT57_RHIMU